MPGKFFHALLFRRQKIPPHLLEKPHIHWHLLRTKLAKMLGNSEWNSRLTENSPSCFPGDKMFMSKKSRAKLIWISYVHPPVRIKIGKAQWVREKKYLINNNSAVRTTAASEWIPSPWNKIALSWSVNCRCKHLYQFCMRLICCLCLVYIWKGPGDKELKMCYSCLKRKTHYEWTTPL